jgi:hypothetical protein
VVLARSGQNRQYTSAALSGLARTSICSRRLSDARDQHRYIWKKGEYGEERKGERWVPYKWEERNGGYHMNEGYWEHD